MEIAKKKYLMPSLGNIQTICFQRKTGGTGVPPVCGSAVPLAMPSAQTGGTPVPPDRGKARIFSRGGLITGEDNMCGF
jgi:hypothetical protein